jgi:hypothetical protein
MEYVLNTKVPTMTSNTTPEGVASASSEYDNNTKAYKAFDGNDSTDWGTTDNHGAGSWLKYEFPSAVSIHNFKLHPKYYAGNGGLYLKEYKIQGSNDDFVSDIHDLYSETLPNEDVGAVDRYFANDTAYKYYRLLAVSTYITTYNIVNILTLQFYGHADTGEKIHGATNETAYYLDGATQVPISNPSTLDEGTYTFGSTVAKNPDSLSSDYTKQIRITPNTVEVVLRPDNALFWWGYDSPALDNPSIWAGQPNANVACTKGDYYYHAESSANNATIGLKDITTAITRANAVVDTISGTAEYVVSLFITVQTATDNFEWESPKATGMKKLSVNYVNTITPPYAISVGSEKNKASCNIYALWYE